MGCFIGALQIGKVRGTWHSNLISFIFSFPCLLLILVPSYLVTIDYIGSKKEVKNYSLPLLISAPTGSEHKKSHTAFPMELQLVHYKVISVFAFFSKKWKSSNKAIRRIGCTSSGGVFRPECRPEGGSTRLSCYSFRLLLSTTSFPGKYQSRIKEWKWKKNVIKIQVDLPSFDLLISGLENITKPSSRTQVFSSFIFIKLDLFWI